MIPSFFSMSVQYEGILTQQGDRVDRNEVTWQLV